MYIRLGYRVTTMKNVTKNFAAALLASGLVFAGLSGCATTAESVDSSAELQEAAAGHVVFGKFRLVRNGHVVQLNEGILSNTATFSLTRDGVGEEITAKVGEDGEFAWVLAPGQYKVSGIGFNYHGERIKTPANFAFTAAADHGATYVGTITLETSFYSSSYGTIGAVDSFTVANDCASDCKDRLTRLGLSPDDATIALFPQVNQMARRY